MCSVWWVITLVTFSGQTWKWHGTLLIYWACLSVYIWSPHPLCRRFLDFAHFLEAHSMDVLFFFFFGLVFWDRVSLCSLSWNSLCRPGWHMTDICNLGLLILLLCPHPYPSHSHHPKWWDCGQVSPTMSGSKSCTCSFIACSNTCDKIIILIYCFVGRYKNHPVLKATINIIRELLAPK
jgi:hypothetical protein